MKDNQFEHLSHDEQNEKLAWDSQQPKRGHTHGPWNAKDSIVYSLESGKYVARCDIGGRDEETEANARLIAAAPDLLGALKEALDQLETWNTESEPTFTMRRASEAIAKAEGRHVA